MSEETIPQENSPESESASAPPPPPSIPELEKFIFEPDEYTRGVVPRKLSAQEVAKFLLGKIGKDTKLNSFIQVELAADFYDTFEVVKKFRQFLDRSESNPEEVRRGTIIARIVARLGDDEDVAFARQYYKHLVGRADSVPEFEDLILLHEALGLGGNSSEIRQKIQTKLAGLAAKKEGDYQATLEYRKFEETILNKLNRAERVEAIKDKIAAIADRHQRLEEEIKAYLTIEYGFLEYLQPWAARRLRKETWVAQPAEQSRRVDGQPLKEDVVRALKTFLEKADELPNLQPQEKESVKLRILRAVKFFGGKVSPEEEAFLELHKATQADILANEGFLIK